MNNLQNYHSNQVNKLISNYKQYNNLIIGVDFDDTIRNWFTGQPINEVVSILKECNDLNLTICLYTVREDKELHEAYEYCKGIGLNISYLNYSPLSPGMRKPLFNILLDDRAGLNESLNILKEVIEKIKN